MKPVGVSHYLKKMTWHSSGFKFIRAISPQHTFILFSDVHFFRQCPPKPLRACAQGSFLVVLKKQDGVAEIEPWTTMCKTNTLIACLKMLYFLEKV